eukprot:TCONS_00053104-protein
MERVIIFLALIGLASSMSIKFNPCESSRGKSTASNISLIIEPCTAEPCKLIKGQSSSIAVHFTPANVAKTLAVSVHAKIASFWVPYSIDKPDACKDSGLTCPLAAGTEADYEYSLKVSTAYPSISLPLEWKITDDTGASPVCVVFPIVVTSSAASMYEEESLALIP